MAAPRVLVVGAGATGACAAFQLRQVLGRDVSIEVWEKARGPGGRMSTTRQELGGVNVRADMGAQYLSLDVEDPACAEVAKLLVKEGACREVPHELLAETPERAMEGSWRHLAGVGGGVNDALKVLLEQAGAQPFYEKRVASLDEQQGKWRARPFEGAPGVFDAVVVAVPGCGVGGDNLNKIRGGWENWINAEQNRRLQDVGHDQRWAFALFLPLECAAECDQFFGPKAVEKVVDDAKLHLLCYQSRKTSHASGGEPEAAIVVVAHTSLAWAKKNARASGRDGRLLSEISEHVAARLGLKKGASAILSSKVITWKQCQVTNAAEGGPSSCMVLGTSPPLLLAGDYFTESSFGGCLKSGFGAAGLAARLLKGEAPAAILTAAGVAEAGTGGGDKGRAAVMADSHGKGKGKRSGGGKAKGYSEAQEAPSAWGKGGKSRKGGGYDKHEDGGRWSERNAASSWSTGGSSQWSGWGKGSW